MDFPCGETNALVVEVASGLAPFPPISGSWDGSWNTPIQAEKVPSAVPRPGLAPPPEPPPDPIPWPGPSRLLNGPLPMGPVDHPVGRSPTVRLIRSARRWSSVRREGGLVEWVAPRASGTATPAATTTARVIQTTG